MLLFDTLSERELKEGLKALGVQPGRDLCVHSQLFSFGKPHLLKALLLAKIVDILRQCVGKACLIMPTFTYSFCKGLPFNSLKSKSTMGALSEFYRHQSGVKRTKDPIFSFAVSGENEEDYLHDTTSCFGKNSVYDVLFRKGGYILLLGTTQKGWTFTHYLEEKYQSPYRFYKNFSGISIDEKGVKTQDEILYYVRKLDMQSDINIPKSLSFFAKDGVYEQKLLADGKIALLNTHLYAQSFAKQIKLDPYFFVSKDES